MPPSRYSLPARGITDARRCSLSSHRVFQYLPHMTHSSLSIEVYPAAATPAEMESYATKSTRLLDLEHRSRDCYPHQLSSWAQSRDMPVFFVDNEWVRVPVTAAQLGEFVEEVLGIGDASDLITRAGGAEGVVVIESEAF
jgi:hypothetical protein